MRLRRRGPVRPTGTYSQWNWPPSSDGYGSFEWDLTVNSDPSPDGYFWSHQFWLVGGEAGYAGLQTSGSEPTGKIAIFSVWGAIAAEGPVYSAPFSGEGTGYSVRIPYQWRVGPTYRLSVEAQGEQLWAARVGEEDGPQQQIGTIEVPPAWGRLRDVSVMWTERYSGPLSSCAEMGYSSARFSAPTADEGAVTPSSHRNFLGQPPGCPGSTVTDVAAGVVHVMGERGRPSGA